jgi:hypothetical protein
MIGLAKRSHSKDVITTIKWLYITYLVVNAAIPYHMDCCSIADLALLSTLVKL